MTNYIINAKLTRLMKTFFCVPASYASGIKGASGSFHLLSNNPKSLRGLVRDYTGLLYHSRGLARRVGLGEAIHELLVARPWKWVYVAQALGENSERHGPQSPEYTRNDEP